MDGRRRRHVKETFDIGLGFVGFFTAAFFAITLFLEVTGRDALASAVTTLVLALVLTGIWVLRRYALSRPEGPGRS